MNKAYQYFRFERIVSYFVATAFISLSSAGTLFAQTVEASSPQRALESASMISQAFREASARVIPATIKIISHVRTTAEIQAMQVGKPAIRGSRDTRQQGDSTGTGVIIHPKGIVLTNNHVVYRAKEIEVELPDGRKYYVKKFRHDPETDLAILWLDIEESETLPYAVFGDSDEIQIAEWVLAIGNPFELDSTVSVGIISAKGRSLNQVQRTEFLQTDASINPGNSGGPLINLKGEIIGINTAIVSQSGGNQGIGFALPSNNAKWVADQIVSKGKVERAWLGIITYPVTPWEAKRLGVKPRTGVIVDYTVQNSPGEIAGLQSDDVILSFDDQPINEVYQLQRYSERADMKKMHKMVIVRGGKKYSVDEIEAKPLPPSASSTQMLGARAESYVDNQLGMMVLQGEDAMINRLKIIGKRGVIIMSIIPGSRAEKAGLEIGMLITRVDGIQTPTRQDFIGARDAGSLSSGIVLDVVRPGGKEQKITVKLGQ